MKKATRKASSALLTTTLSVLAASVLTACGGSSDSTPTVTTPTIAAGTLLPASGETAAYADTRLQISFDAAPTIGTSGFINVYRASDNVLVDRISVNALDSGSYVADATAATPTLTSSALNSYAGADYPYTAADGSSVVLTKGGDINNQTGYADTDTEVDAIGGTVTTLKGAARWVFYTPITISGNTATIRLHDGKLAPSTAYYVKMDNGVLNGTVKGTAFAGINTTTDWAFTTKAAPDANATTAVTVAASGDADFRTVQGALDWVMNNCAISSTNSCSSALVAKNITIKNGTYEEQLWLSGVNNLTITGESRDGVKVQYKNLEEYNPGTGASATFAKMSASTSGLWKPMKEKTGFRPYLGGGRAVFLIEGSDLLTLNQFTLKNTTVKDAKVNNQAETIYFNSGNGRLSATYMNFLSAQDTIQVKGWSWFYKNLIAGDVDFIWGSPYTALFEDSEVRTVVDTTDATLGGYLVQARGYYGYPGFVFLNSRLTREKGVPDGNTDLARSGGKYCNASGVAGGATPYTKGLALYCDVVTYVNTTMDSHIAAAGWHTNADKTKEYPNLPANAAMLNGSNASQWANYLDIGSTYSTATKTTTVGTYGIAAAQGWYEYGSKTMNGTPILSHGTDVTGYTQQMSDRIYKSSYSNRNQILQSYGTNNAGWAPTAATCSSSACATSL